MSIFIMYKVSVLLIATFFFNLSSLRADNAPMQEIPLLRYLAENAPLREFAIEQLISKRCNLYLDYPKSAACRKTTRIMIEELNFDLIATSSSSFVFCAFHQKLKTLLNQNETTQFLKSVRQNINKFLTGESSAFSLWEFSSNYFNSQKKAAEYIAILFQDISQQKLHLSYLNLIHYQGNKTFGINKDELSSTIDEIRFLIDHFPDSTQEVLYPYSIKTKLNPSLYHFYLPLYLGQKLQDRLVTSEDSYIAPLFLSLTYEFVTSSADYRYLLLDPDKLDAIKNEWKIKDIYAAHAGASFMIGRKLVSLESIQMAFNQSSELAVSLLIKASTVHPMAGSDTELYPASASDQ